MNKNLKLISVRIVLAVAAGLAASTLSSQAQSAAASLSAVPSGGGYNYTITLTNTGSTALNSFWYGWTTSGNNLPSIPTSPGNSLVWGNSVVGNSIEWINSSGTALLAGHTGVFTFASTSTPAQMTAGIAGQSVAYVGGIDFSQNVPGDSTAVFAPVLIVPEPSALGLLLVGSLGWLATGWRKLRA